MVTIPKWLADQVSQLEGYNPKAYWDYGQWSIGHGTKAPGRDATITQEQARADLERELQTAATYVDAKYPNVDPRYRPSLVSLTYNAGPGWMDKGLGQAVASGDWNAAGQLFNQYNKADGQTLRGLQNRRATEWGWTQQDPATQQTAAAANAVRGGSMNGGYGMSPTGTAGIAGPIQTTDKGHAVADQAPFKDFQAPAQPQVSGWAEEATPAFSPDFNTSDVAGSLMSLGNAVGKMMGQGVKPPPAPVPTMRGPNPDLSMLAKVLAGRQKKGI